MSVVAAAAAAASLSLWRLLSLKFNLLVVVSGEVVVDCVTCENATEKSGSLAFNLDLDRGLVVLGLRVVVVVLAGVVDGLGVVGGLVGGGSVNIVGFVFTRKVGS